MSEQNIPNIFLALKEKQPAFLDAVEALGQALREAGPVDTRTAQFIQLAAAAAIRSGMHGVCTVPRGLYR
jgi:alkylhydroperoxidase/carboxymuconolactone decarboxylase family protein YurZ